MLPHFEIQKYYQNEPKFHDVYSRNNLPKIKDWAYVINIDEYELIRTHWIPLYVNANNIIYFDSCGVENIPKEIKKFIGNKNIIINNYRIQAYDSIMRVRFIDFMLKGKSLLDCTNVFSFYDYDKNNKIILKYERRKNYIALFAVNIENSKKHKISYLLEKTLVLYIILVNVKMKVKKYLKKKNQNEILKILGLIENI